MPYSRLLALFLLLSFAGTLFANPVSDFEGTAPGDLPDGWSSRLVKDRDLHQVGVEAKPGLPEAGGGQVLRVVDADKENFPHSPEAVYSFPRSDKGLELSLDFYLPEGRSDNNPMILIGNSQKKDEWAVMLHLNNDGKLLNRKGESIGKVSEGRWYRIHLFVPRAGEGSTYSVELLGWDDLEGEYIEIAERSGMALNKVLTAYDRLQIRGYVWGKGQDKHAGEVWIDNVILTQMNAAESKKVEQSFEVDYEFSEDLRKFSNVKPERNVSITGRIPRGWKDRSGYQSDIEIDYGEIEIDGTRGLAVKKKGAGEVQMFLELPALQAGRYELNVKGRNPQMVDLIIGLRDNGPPYKWPWRTQGLFGDEWRMEESQFELDKPYKGVGLYIIAKGPERMEFALSEISLRRLSEQEVFDRLKQEFPDGGPSNLFRSTSLLYGLPAGWSFTHDTEAATDSGFGSRVSEMAPSGSGTVGYLISPSGEVTLNSEPMRVIQPDKTHTISFFAKGEGDWKAELVSEPKTVLIEETFQPTSDWHRVSMTFQPDIYAPRVYLRIIGSGEIELDAFQLEPLGEASVFHRGYQAEVGISLDNPVEPQVAVLHGSDQEAEFSFAVTQAHEGDVLMLRVHDVYGDESAQTLKRFERDQDFIELRWSHLPDRRPLGAFRIEAWLEDSTGEQVSAYQERVYLRTERPPFFDVDAPESYFGVHMYPDRRMISFSKAVGINWVRLHDQSARLTEWFHLEPEPGEWKFKDAQIELFRSGRINILAMLSSAPPWASIDQLAPTDRYYYYGKYFYPDDLKDWENYVSRFVGRYSGIISAYDVWNEPWGGGYLNAGFDPSKRNRAMFEKIDQPVQRYMDLVRSAYNVVKRTDPEAQVVVDVSKDHWLKQQLNEGLAEHSDVLAFHSYISGILGYQGDALATRIDDQIEAARELEKPLWMTEGSSVYNTHYSGFYNHTLAGVRRESPLSASAENLMRFELACLREGVTKIFMYTLRFGHFTQRTTPWALLVMEDGQPHPTAAAHAALAAAVDGKPVVDSGKLVENLYFVAFSANGENCIALIDSPDAQLDFNGLQGLSGLVDLFGNGLVQGEEMRFPLYYKSSQSVSQMLKELRATLFDG